MSMKFLHPWSVVNKSVKTCLPLKCSLMYLYGCYKFNKWNIKEKTSLNFNIIAKHCKLIYTDCFKNQTSVLKMLLIVPSSCNGYNSIFQIL